MSMFRSQLSRTDKSDIPAWAVAEHVLVTASHLWIKSYDILGVLPLGGIDAIFVMLQCVVDFLWRTPLGKALILLCWDANSKKRTTELVQIRILFVWLLSQARNKEETKLEDQEAPAALPRARLRGFAWSTSVHAYIIDIITWDGLAKFEKVCVCVYGCLQCHKSIHVRPIAAAMRVIYRQSSQARITNGDRMEMKTVCNVIQLRKSLKRNETSICYAAAKTQGCEHSCLLLFAFI